jgi:two-component system LytT family response regulator
MTREETRAIVVDDEPLARERLRRLLDAEPDVRVVAECASGREAVREVLAQRPDLLLLDVQMPGIDGFGVLRELRSEAEAGAGDTALPLVIFVTAYDQHALRAFDVHAIDYVLKPVEPDRLRDALARARARHAQASAARRFREMQRLLERVMDGGEAGAAGEPAEATLQPKPQGRWTERILIRERDKLFFVRTAEVDWIEAAGNYVKLYIGKRTHLIRETMSKMEQALDPGQFVRIHRSTIVNLDRVRQMEPWFSGEYMVQMEDGTELRMSRWYRDRVFDRLVRFPADAS